MAAGSRQTLSGGCACYHGRRAFCPDCGTSLSFESACRPEELEVTLGSLEDPALEHNEGPMPDDETR